MTEKTLTLHDLQALALHNGLVILDYLDAEMLKDRFPNMDDKDADQILGVLSTCLGDYDESAINREGADAVIREVAEREGVNLDANEARQ